MSEAPSPFLIFLDIDGVLNSVQSLHYYGYLVQKGIVKTEPDGSCYEVSCMIHFCPIAANNLRLLLRELPEAKIVLSSTWRKTEARRADLERLFKEFDLPHDRIIGRTPNLFVRRGLEIQQWLDENPDLKPQDFVIIDDDSDMEHLMSHLIKIDGRIGFTYRDVIQIIARFRGKETSEVDRRIPVYPNKKGEVL